MRFRLQSEQLTVENAEVSFGRDALSAAVLADDLSSVSLRRNVTEDVPRVSPGEIELLCSKCEIRSHKSNIVYPVPMFRLKTAVRGTDIARESMTIVVGFHAFVHVRAVSRDGHPLTRDHTVGITLPDMSLEVHGPKYTPLHAVLPPGDYVAYVAGPRPARRRLSVRENNDDVEAIITCEDIDDQTR
jgi:hypothetical protein